MLIALAIAACGGDDEPDVTEQTEVAPTSTSAEPQPEPEPERPERERNGGGEDGETDESEAADPDPELEADRDRPEPRFSPEQREAQRVARRYLEAIDSRDGAAVCAALAPGAIDELELPVERGSCAASVEASIGYKAPGGLPVYEGSRVNGFVSTTLEDYGVQVVAAVQTDFSDRDEPSVEDDVVYLTDAGGKLLVAKPSTSLYRAVGVADIPPSVISPPR
ncbi:hypothetical protein HJD18_15280 [Thermoleophilia bacterium SCSIO 60948]|nr:hypothetical protein HJD18_15280 [Thermoleophilia bacterium SCSIO 60948]